MITRNNGYFHAVQVDSFERVAQDHRHRFGHVALTGVGFVNPVTHIGRLKRTSLQAAQTHFTHERALVG